MAKKRSNGEGSVRRKKSGRWVGQIMDGYTDDGKRKIITFFGATKGETLDKIRDFRNQESTNLSIDKKLKLEDWADTWYADYRTQVQPSTYSGYKYTLSIIKKHLGSRKLYEVLPIHINRFMDELVQANYSLSLIQKCRAMLIQIFDSAEGNGLVEKNPANRAKVIRSQPTAQAIQQKDAFTDQEVDTLCTELENTLIGNSIRLMLNTGLRGQELLALASEDIAEDGSTVSVTKAIQMVDGVPRLGPPKSKRSRRVIPVPQHCRDCALLLRRHGCGGLIWKWSGDNPYYTVSAFRHRYYMAIKGVDGVRRLSPHCCRHTYVTRLQAAGVSIELIARLAGHGNVNVTDGYTHTSDNTLQQAVALLEGEKKAVV